MYSRPVYVALLGLSVGALILAAGVGEGAVKAAAYALAFGLGSVVFYHGEARVTRGPIVANATISLVVATAVAVLVVASLLMTVIGAPWDLALWQGGLRVWSAVVGIGFTFTTAFFVVGAVASLR